MHRLRLFHLSTKDRWRALLRIIRVDQVLRSGYCEATVVICKHAFRSRCLSSSKMDEMLIVTSRAPLI